MGDDSLFEMLATLIISPKTIKTANKSVNKEDCLALFIDISPISPNKSTFEKGVLLKFDNQLNPFNAHSELTTLLVTVFTVGCCYTCLKTNTANDQLAPSSKSM